MKTGIRFTCLENGDNLLGQNWTYKTKTGVEAIVEKVADMFEHVSNLNITYVIDKLVIGKDKTNSLYLPNTGINGNLWPITERLGQYNLMIQKYNIDLVVEIEYPTRITSFNYMDYAKYTVELISKYSFIKNWQIMTNPEEVDKMKEYKCPPDVYVQMMKYIYPLIHDNYSDIKIGGPGCSDAINEYVKTEYKNEDKQVFHQGWLAAATGEYYGTSPQYDATEKGGFLQYIDFFAFQGDNSTGKFTYETFPAVIVKLKQGLNKQAQRAGFNLNVEYWSTKQGHMANYDNVSDLQLQAYRDLKEYMVDFAMGIIPFKKQLVDEFYDPNSGLDLNAYGILYYYLGLDRKPSFQQFKFILKMLEDYDDICRDELLIKAKRPYDITTADVQSVMFMAKDKSKVLTIVYPAIERIISEGAKNVATVTLKPALNRTIHVPDGSQYTITTPTNVNFKSYDFIAVEESLIVSTKNKEELRADVTNKLNFYNTYIQNLLKMVPDDYNKEVYDTNFYNLLRAAGIEFGDLRYDMSILKDNYFLRTAHGDAIFNNFGAIIGVKWKPKWSEKQYRSAVSGIIEALFHGANKNSIAKAIKLYTGYSVKIYELFKDYGHYGIPQNENWENQYRFTVEVEKDIDESLDVKEAYDETKEVLDLTRPAHTLPIIMIVLVGRENYREWYKQRYGIDFSKSDKFDPEYMILKESNKYGWKSINYDWVLHHAETDNHIKTNSIYPIGPRYTLYDRVKYNYKQLFRTHIRKPIDTPWAELVSWYKDKYERPIYEDLVMENYMEFYEVKYGIKPTLEEKILKTNGGLLYDKDGNVIGSEHRKLNTFRYGVKYALKDEFFLGREYYAEDKFHKVLDSLVNTFVRMIFEDIYDLPIDDEITGWDTGVVFTELKYGYAPSYACSFITYKPDTPGFNRVTNRTRWGVYYRLKDNRYYFDISTPFKDSFKTPTPAPASSTTMTKPFTESVGFVAGSSASVGSSTVPTLTETITSVSESSTSASASSTKPLIETMPTPSGTMGVSTPTPISFKESKISTIKDSGARIEMYKVDAVGTITMIRSEGV